jgi:hypothetical protein
MAEKETSNEKKTYEPPHLRKVSLAAEEVLAVGCKTNSGGFNVAAPRCMMNQCVKNGS